MDTRMEGHYSSKAVLQAAELTLKCLALDPKGCPSIKEVAAALECIEAIKGKPKKYKINSNAAAQGQHHSHHHSPFHARHHGAET